MFDMQRLCFSAFEGNTNQHLILNCMEKSVERTSKSYGLTKNSIKVEYGTLRFFLIVRV